MSLTIATYPSEATLFAGNEHRIGLTTDYVLPSTVRLTLKFYSGSAKTAMLYSIVEQKSPTANSVAFDIGPFVDAYLQSRDSLLDISALATDKVQATANYCYVRAEFSQIDAEGNQQGATVWREYRAIKAATEADTDYFADYLENYSAILTFVPQPAKYSAFSGVFFSYYNKLSRLCKVLARFTFSGGTSSTVVLKQGNFSEGIFNFYFSQADLLTASGTAFEKVEFWLQNNVNTNISSLVKFVFDSDFRQFERILLVENSLGGLDFFRITGKISDSSKFSRTSGQFSEKILTTYVERGQSFSANSGFFWSGNDQLQAYQNWFVAEILAAKMAYLITSERITQVRISTETATAYEDGEFVTSELLKLDNVKIIKSFTTPAIDLPDPTEVEPANYFELGYINTGYYGNI